MKLNVTVREPREVAKEEPKRTNNNTDKLTSDQNARLKTILEKIDNEKYVLLYNNNFKKIFGKTMKESNEVEGFVKIEHNCKTAYRRFRGYKVDGNSILMGQRTMNKLGVGDSDEVTVSKACWFCYLWCNQDSCIKHPFRLAFIGIVFAILGLIVSVISLICSGHCC